MATGFWNNLTGKLGNAGGVLANALLGSANTTVNQPQGQYPDGIQNYLDSLENQPYYQKLLNQPKETRLTPEQYKEGIAQGLNFGVPEIADAQDALKINKPKTAEEINLAQTGQFNTYPIKTGLTTGPRQGGFLNDFAKGYQENYQNSFEPNNLAPQNKSWATRIGEGLGSVGRFIDSPLGRGLIAYGLNEALGYDDSFKEGLSAFIARQNAQTADNLYRQNLANNGIDLSGIKGNVTSEMYKQVANDIYRQNSLQAKKDIAEAKDNVSRARMIMTALNNGTITPAEAQMQMANYGVTLNDVQESNNTRLLPYRQYAMQVAPQVALGNLGVAQGNLGLRQAEFNYQQALDQFKRNNPQIDPKTKLSLRDKTDALTQIQELRKLVNDNPNATGLVVGSLAKGKELSQKIANSNSTKGEIQTRAGIAKLRGTTMHDLAGTAQTLQEQRNLAPFLPDATDDVRTINAKLDQLEAEINREYNGIVNSFGGSYSLPQQNTGGQTQTIGKYKVRVK